MSPGFRVWASLLLAIAVAGCAADRAYDEGRNLMAQGQAEAGLTQLREAVRLRPTNPRFRMTWLQARDQTLVQWQQQAEDALARQERTTAESLYQRMLGLDAGNAAARAGLVRIARLKQRDQWLQNAKAAWERHDASAALALVRSVLAETPDDARALALRGTIDAWRAEVQGAQALPSGLLEPVTLEFRDASVAQVFESLARTSGLNFIFDREVRTDQRVSLFLRNTTVEAALQVILLTQQLERRMLDSSTLLVYPANPTKLREYQPLRVRTFFLANAEAKTVSNTLRTLMKVKDVVTDDKLNMVMVRDTPEALRIADRLVALHDLPEPEVMLEVEVLEVNRSKLLSLGVQWPGTLSLVPLGSGAQSTVTLDDLLHLSPTTTQATLGATTVNAHVQDGAANLLANPRIRSRNREKAKILVGDKVPVITTTLTPNGLVSESVQYIDVGLKLEVEPVIYPDNEVAIRVGMEVSTLSQQMRTANGTLAYQIGTRNASTVLRLRDGETQVLAGLINDEDRRSGNKIPGLGELPLLGRLFGSEDHTQNQTEIVLSITPRVVRNIRLPSSVEADFASGTEASWRELGFDALGLPIVVNPPTDPVKSASGLSSAISEPGRPGSRTLTGPALRWIAPASVQVGTRFETQLLWDGPITEGEYNVVLGLDLTGLEVLDDGEVSGAAATSGDGRPDAITFPRLTRNAESGQIHLHWIVVAGSPRPAVTLHLSARTPGSASLPTVLSAQFEPKGNDDATRSPQAPALPVNGSIRVMP